MGALQSILGLVVFLAIPVALSRARSEISWRFVAIGLGLQFVLALLMLRLPIVSDGLLALSGAVKAVQAATDKATQFMFGHLAGGPPPYEITAPENAFVVALQVFPLILVIAVLSALLFHFRVLTVIVGAFGWLLRRTLRISGPLGFGAAATLFLGTIEAPLMVRPYLDRLSRAELLALIVCTMSTIAGTVIVLYASVLEPILPGALAHLLTASIISVPAALVLAHVWLPAAPSPEDAFVLERSDRTWVEVLLDAVEDGIKMIASIIAIIIVLFALINLADAILGQIHAGWSVGGLLGFLLRPVMWLVGFGWADARLAGELMGTKIVLNEFVAYLQLSKVEGLSPRDIVVLVYSLCGFANLASCGIVIAGLTAIMPDRRREIVDLTFVSLLLGNLATLMTGVVYHLLSAV